MMQLTDFLEDFEPETISAAEGRAALAEEEIEALRLEAFEKGYKDGWEDAARAMSDEQSHIGGTLARNLQDLSFTYTEATAHVMNSLVPLLRQMVTVLLPEVARASFGTHIVDRLEALARSQSAKGIEIHLSPDDAPTVAPLLDRDFGFPVMVVQDQRFGSGQADLLFAEGGGEKVDLAEILDELRTLIEGFAGETEKEIAHG